MQKEPRWRLFEDERSRSHRDHFTSRLFPAVARRNFGPDPGQLRRVAGPVQHSLTHARPTPNLDALAARCRQVKVATHVTTSGTCHTIAIPFDKCPGRATRGSAVLVGEDSRRRCLDALGAPKFGLASSMFRRNPTFDSTVHPSGRCRSDEGADNTPVDHGLRSGSLLVTDDWAQWGKNPTDLRIFLESDGRSGRRGCFWEWHENERWSSLGLDHRWGSFLQSRTA